MNMPKRVAILGATGFIGRGLPALFAQENAQCTGISRSGSGVVPNVNHWQTLERLDFSDHFAVINLAGEPIAKRWSAENKRRFHESRVGLTRRVVDAIVRLPAEQRPKVLVNASAVGIYGDRGDTVLTEVSEPGHDYLAELCREWENAAIEAEALGVRVVRLRTGIVLGRGGDAFKKLAGVFKLGIGGRLGSGHQWMPWIHIEDQRAAVIHAVFSENLSGAVNVCAPVAERNADFTRKLASALHRPAILPVPAFALRLALGGFGNALLASQHARPAALESDGFQFRFPTFESALADLIR
ncbi:MAG: TIGR01777 family protein [Gloeobacteraceae cyanobacterium ES-bin-144]|nr:TIGR01777 family protein [Verrucomicrobiales bacterium]